MKKKFFLKTFGCQMNVADTERMHALLQDQGMEATPQVEDADIVLINGCSVREKAVHKAVSSLGAFHHRGLKHDGEGAKKERIFGVGGCVGQLEKDSLFEQFPYLDFVFGPDTIDQLPEMIFLAESGHRKKLYADFDKKMGYRTETRLPGKSAQAFVNIMKGCDKFCTYCIVPFTRGREKSRAIDEVLDDLARLVSQGVREVTLLGQNVNSFGKGNPNLAEREPRELHSPIGKVGPRAGEENFPQLLRAIEEDSRLSGLKRIRFTSSHPLDFSDELLGCYAAPEAGGLSKLAHQLHLPVQSGADSMLRRMGRHHSIETYIEQMERLRAMAPGIGLSTDLIVGFPGETEEEFQATLRLMDRIRYDHVYAFAYSPRPGTKAAKLTDDVPDEVKNHRLNELLRHQSAISEDVFRSHIGSVVEVLVEGEAKNQHLAERSGSLGRVWTGRTSCGKVANFIAEGTRNLTGYFLAVRVTGSTPLSLHGEPVHDAGFAETDPGYRSPTVSEVAS